MKRVAVGVLLFSGLFLGAWLLRQDQIDLPRYASVPDLTFTNAEGKAVSLHDLKGKPWLLGFFFSSCKGVCPRVNHALEAKFPRLAKASPRLSLVSVSVDPERDTPERLKEYGRQFSFPAGAWHLLVGPENTLKELADGVLLGLPGQPDVHSTKVLLVDSELNVRGFYQALELEEELPQLLRALRALER